MLKIKDSIDLKELEKFGFIKLDRNRVQNFYKRGNIFIYCDCDKANKILNTTTEKINVIRKKSGLHLIFEGAIVETDGYHTKNIIEDKNYAIQDLIQAGLVEKVEG